MTKLTNEKTYDILLNLENENIATYYFKNLLVEAGLLVTHKVPNGGRGRHAVVYTMTEKGVNLLTRGIAENERMIVAFQNENIKARAVAAKAKAKLEEMAREKAKEAAKAQEAVSLRQTMRAIAKRADKPYTLETTLSKLVQEHGLKEVVSVLESQIN